MQIAQLRVAKMPNLVTDATKLETVEKTWPEAYCLFLMRPGRKREEEQWKGMCGYGGMWRISCKINQTTKVGGLSDSRGESIYSQQCCGPADSGPWGWQREPNGQPPGLSISSVPGRLGVGRWSKDGQNCILILRRLGRKGWQNCILIAAVCN